jgi:rod shape-determining protein MreD
VKVAWVFLATIVALVLQTTLARIPMSASLSVDLVLVAVIYAALSAGPVTGMLTGTFAGLVQDALSTGAGVGVIGIGGFSKMLVGLLAGIVGTQFIVAQPFSRFVVFLVASILHGATFMGIYALLGLREFGSPYASILEQAVANAVIGVIAFQLSEFLPGSVERRRHGRMKPHR